MLKISELRTALADKGDLQRQLAEANETITTLRGELQSAQDSAAAEKTRADALEAQIVEANSTIEGLNGQVTTLEKEKKTVSQATVEKLHELGVPASQLPKAAATGEDDADLLARYSALSGRERTKFFRENRAALERAVAKK